MSAPTKQPANVLDRIAPNSATQLNNPSAGTSAPKAHPEFAEVPIGVLEVPIGVWGSRRVGSNLGQSERVEVFAEDTCTVIVFPQGAVIRLSASVAAGQLVMVANRKSGHIILCRVVNVRTYPHVRGYAEIEFMQSATGFWGSYTPQGTLKLSTELRPAAPSTSPEDLWNSAFPKEVISVLANVSLAAPSTHSILRTETDPIEDRAIQIPFVEKLPQRVATVAIDSGSHFETAERNRSNQNPRLTEVSTQGSARFRIWNLLDSLRGPRIQVRVERTPSPKRRVALVPVMTSLLLMGVTGILLLHYGTAKDSGITQPDPMPEVSIGSPIANGIQGPQPKSDTSSAVPGLPIAKIENFPGNHTRELADNIRISHPSTRKPTPERKIPNERLLAPLSTANRAAAMGRDVPPAVTGSDPNTGADAIQGFVAALLPTGGRAKEPQLLSSSAPIYPPAARQARVEGQVTIDAVVDTNGKLTSVKVVSGAPLLQQAALDSLRTWKYQPAYLNEKPVPVKTSIIVNFRLR